MGSAGPSPAHPSGHGSGRTKRRLQVRVEFDFQEIQKLSWAQSQLPSWNIIGAGNSRSLSSQHHPLDVISHAALFIKTDLKSRRFKQKG